MELHSGTILDAAVLADPGDFYSFLREHHPVWKVPDMSVVYVASHANVVEAVRRVDDFSNHLDALIIRGNGGAPELWETGDMDAGTTTLATADPPEHTTHRNLVFPELVARRMATIEHQVEVLVDDQMQAARFSICARPSPRRGLTGWISPYLICRTTYLMVIMPLACGH